MKNYTNFIRCCAILMLGGCQENTHENHSHHHCHGHCHDHAKHKNDSHSKPEHGHRHHHHHHEKDDKDNKDNNRHHHGHNHNHNHNQDSKPIFNKKHLTTQEELDQIKKKETRELLTDIENEKAHFNRHHLHKMNSEHSHRHHHEHDSQEQEVDEHHKHHVHHKNHHAHHEYCHEHEDKNHNLKMHEEKQEEKQIAKIEVMDLPKNHISKNEHAHEHHRHHHHHHYDHTGHHHEKLKYKELHKENHSIENEKHNLHIEAKSAKYVANQEITKIGADCLRIFNVEKKVTPLDKEMFEEALQMALNQRCLMHWNGDHISAEIETSDPVFIDKFAHVEFTLILTVNGKKYHVKNRACKILLNSHHHHHNHSHHIEPGYAHGFWIFEESVQEYIR